MFVLGTTYKRSDLHKSYGGQRQGGISTPSGRNFILLFTGEQGEQYGYRDGWTEEGLFLYTGEGQSGDMVFARGNLAIRDHVADGKDLHLFEYVNKGQVRYVGQMACTGFQERRGPDIDGTDRRIIVFELTPINAFDASIEPEDEKIYEEMWEQPLEELRERAIASAANAKTPSERRFLARYRSSAIRVYVLKRAGGICEACDSKAPFLTGVGRPYLEPHHIRRLSDGGPDHPEWVITLCPNCHRRGHYSADREVFNQQLMQIVRSKEVKHSS